MTLKTDFSISLVANESNPLDFVARSAALNIARAISLANGVAANQADMHWSDQRTLAPSGTENLDFAGSLTPPLGSSTLTFVRLKLIVVYAAIGNTNNVNVTQPASNGVPGIFLAASDGTPVRPGGLWVWAAPDATGAVVTPTTGDLITLTNSAGTTSVTYDIAVIGCSA